jgi:hypothetical protein
MASITFEGPDPTDLTQRSTVVVTMDDQALLAVVQAFCELDGYNPELHGGPGMFTIQRTIDFWVQKAEYAGTQQDRAAADVASAARMGPMKESITVTVPSPPA